MNKLVLEIGFIELLVAVFGSAMMGVLLMVLYHRLAMRRERELMLRLAEKPAQAASLPETIAPVQVPVAIITPPVAPTPEREAEIAAAVGPAVNMPDSTDSLDFHSPKSGA